MVGKIISIFKLQYIQKKVLLVRYLSYLCCAFEGFERRSRSSGTTTGNGRELKAKCCHFTGRWIFLIKTKRNKRIKSNFPIKVEYSFWQRKGDFSNRISRRLQPRI